MIGIYSWKNNLNNKRYVGQSVDIERRKKQHITQMGQLNTKLSRALATYGLNNFTFEILEETTPDQLNEREKYWIHKYDTINNGYNITDVDCNGAIIHGENNPNAILSNNDVLSIRKRVHLNHEPMTQVYTDYSHLISYDTFWSAVHGNTWTHLDTSIIQPIKQTNIGSQNNRSILNEDEVLIIRNRIYKQSESIIDVYQDYHDIISYSAFVKMAKGHTWTNVDCSMISSVSVKRKNKPKAKLTKDDVIQIRYDYDNHIKDLSEICKEYSFVTPGTIQRVIKRETWKNI